MGMFTSIIHPKDGHELQIKTGWDDCDTYHVGDTVPFKIVTDIFESGGIFDDVYDSYSKSGRDDWVIIKNHKIVAVRSKRCKYIDLKKQYKIRKLNKNLWTKKAYEEYKLQQKKFREEEKKFNASLKGKSTKEKLIAIMCRPIKDMPFREGFARKVLKVEPI